MRSDKCVHAADVLRHALAAYLSLLEEEAPGAPWMIAGVSADIRPLIGETVRRGGHLRVGLEDAPLGIKTSNLELVEDAVQNGARARRRAGYPC